jgi:hypothetical protein
MLIDIDATAKLRFVASASRRWVMSRGTPPCFVKYSIQGSCWQSIHSIGAVDVIDSLSVARFVAVKYSIQRLYG